MCVVDDNSGEGGQTGPGGYTQYSQEYRKSSGMVWCCVGRLKFCTDSADSVRCAFSLPTPGGAHCEGDEEVGQGQQGACVN